MRKTLGVCATFVGISRLIAVVDVPCCWNAGVLNGLRNSKFECLNHAAVVHTGKRCYATRAV
jgi:hypothetical protein